MTQYDLISNGLGGLVTTLTKILNLIPLLGAGDLLTVLLNGGLLSVKNLIPVGYVNPCIQNCSVSGGTSVTGQKSTGGFAGEAIGAVMKTVLWVALPQCLEMIALVDLWDVLRMQLWQAH